MRRSVPVLLGCILVIAISGCSPGKRTGAASPLGSFYTPADPPSSRYVIDARIGAGDNVIEGQETIVLKNSGRDPLGIVAFDWNTGPLSSLEVASGGRKLFPPAGSSPAPQTGPIFVRLQEALKPGAGVELDVKFRLRIGSSREWTEFSSGEWYPRLWWDGLSHHDSFSVKLEVPAGVVVAASGRLDAKTGRYEAAADRTFGLYVATGLKTATREVDGVLITSYFTDKGAKAAAVCLEAAADVIHFYNEWLGFYPFPFLTIVPGGSGRWGGYPVATGIVAIHGLETYVDGESPRHWQHITSHEIGHEYWGEWVLDPDTPAWMWIAMGIYADTEFMTVRGFDPDRRAEWMGNYVNAIPMYYDTTLDAPPDRERTVRFDFNNTVVHSKGPAAIFALDSVLGRDVFLRIYKRCLRAFGGRRLGWRDFRVVAEEESGRNLAWFFDAWVRSNQYLCYGIDSKETRADADGGFTSDVRIKRLGTMSMPVPVRAVFEDGSAETALTDRTKAVTTLTFKSRSRLRDVVLDPEKKLARVETPLPTISASAAAKLAFGWEASSAPDVYAAVKNEAVRAGEIWYRLALQLYGADRLIEAADCFARIDGLSADPSWKFGAQGWLGIIADLEGRRTAAIAHYKSALAIDPGQPVRHDQFKITMDRTWLEARLKTPFIRESRVRVPEHPTAAQLTEFVDSLNWSGEGETPLIVFRKTAGLAIAESGFWFKLGLLLFDNGHFREALESFTKTTALETTGVTAFAARVWQGHMNDLLGNRVAALAHYREALRLDPGVPMQHSQWGMTIDRNWVEERLSAPFTWTKR
jgi:tetratricopeptide (TPR) repeat protein